MVDSRCGLHCTGCEYKETFGCGGCIETNPTIDTTTLSPEEVAKKIIEMFL